MAEAKPYSKAQQLARGERRYRRKVASPKQWQAIIAAKLTGKPCRVMEDFRRADVLHHIIPRSLGGDDVAENLVPMCDVCHVIIHSIPNAPELHWLLANLSDAEYAYAVGKAGEDWAERIYGLRYSRV